MLCLSATTMDSLFKKTVVVEDGVLYEIALKACLEKSPIKPLGKPAWFKTGHYVWHSFHGSQKFTWDYTRCNGSVYTWLKMAFGIILGSMLGPMAEVTLINWLRPASGDSVGEFPCDALGITLEKALKTENVDTLKMMHGYYLLNLKVCTKVGKT